MRGLMLRAARPAARPSLRGDRGVVGVLVSMVIACGVLLGMGALVLDVGRIYQNRAELQDGADAGALGIATACALGGACTAASSLPVAAHYATANASALTGHQAAVGLVCGSGSLGACPALPPAGGLVSCPPPPLAGTGYVDVNTSTLTASGSTLLPPLFARLLLGNGSYQGTNVKACAQAVWGPADQATTLAMTISVCSWNALTAGGTSPYGTDAAVVIHGKAAGSCTGPAGQTYPAGFDWLCPNTQGAVTPTCNNNSSCATNITLAPSGSYYTAQTTSGTAPPAPCNLVLPQDLNTVVYVPVSAGAITPPGLNTKYLIVGLAAFKITGWANLSTVIPKSVIPSPEPPGCHNKDACVFGEFSQRVLPLPNAVGSPGTANFGAEAVELSG